MFLKSAMMAVSLYVKISRKVSVVGMASLLVPS